jgi:fructose-bisphosphate aldolase class 1
VASSSFYVVEKQCSGLKLMLIIHQVHEWDNIHAHVDPVNVLIHLCTNSEIVPIVMPKISSINQINFEDGNDISL